MTESGKILFLDPLDAPNAPGSAASAGFDGAPVPVGETLDTLIRIIRECGMDPVTQLAGYLVTDDPTYLPDSAHARAIANHVGRDKLLEALIEFYVESADRSASTL